MAGKRIMWKWRARGGMSMGTAKYLVRERDGYKCTQCGVTDDEHVARYGRRTEVHRIVPGSLYSLKGCVLLCRDCHYPQPRRKRGVKDKENKQREITVSLGKNPHVVLRGRYRDAVAGLAAATGQTPIQVLLAALNKQLQSEGIEPPLPE